MRLYRKPQESEVTMILRFALALFLAALTGPVHALSCMAPDVVWLYQHIKEDEADYLLVKGKVILTELPNYAEPAGMRQTEAFTMARAVGQALSVSGFDAPFDRPITIRSSCAGSWCGAPEGLSEDRHFFALRMEGDRLVLERGPCGGLVERWSEEEEARLLNCHLNGECELKGF